MFLCFIGINGYAAEDIIVKVNDEVVISDVEPIVENNQIWLPLRSVLEASGVYVVWNDKMNQVEVVCNSKDIILKPDVKCISINGNEVILDNAPMMKKDRVFLPLDVFSMIPNVTVKFDEILNTVYLETPQWNIPMRNLYLVQNIFDDDGEQLLIRDSSNLVIFTGNDEVSEKLNNSFYGNYIYGLEGMENDYYTEYRQELKEECQDEYKKDPEKYQPKYQRRTFQIDYGKGDILGLTLVIQDSDGMVLSYPKVFDIKTGEELTLSELLAMEIEEIESVLLHELEKVKSVSEEEKINFLKKYFFAISENNLQIFYPQNLNPKVDELLTKEVEREATFTIPCEQLKWKINLENGIWTEPFYEIKNEEVVYKDIPILITEGIKLRAMDYLDLNGSFFDLKKFKMNVEYISNDTYFSDEKWKLSCGYLTKIEAYAELPGKKNECIDLIENGLVYETDFPDENLSIYDFDEKEAKCIRKSVLYSGGKFSTSYSVIYVVQEVTGNKVKLYVKAEIPDTVFR